MLYHYIKIAFRNLLKYKLQSFICIVGLAIGFTSFALSSLWILLTEGGHFDRPLFAPTSASFPGGSIGRAGDC